MKSIASPAHPNARGGLGSLAVLALAVASILVFAGCSDAPSNPAQLSEVRGAPIKTAVAPMTATHSNAGQSASATAVAAATIPTATEAPSSPAKSAGSEQSLASGASAAALPGASTLASTSATSPVVSSAVSQPQTPIISTASSVPPSAALPARMDNRTATVGFDQLSSYTFEVTDELLGPITNDVASAAAKTNARIPEKIKSFDQKRVALRGFMLPLKVEGGLVTEMLIMKDQSMCCYGTTPRINDWVSVRMKNKGVRPTMDLPVTLTGTLKVGEMRENGYLVGIYSMDGEEMDAPEMK